MRRSLSILLTLGLLTACAPIDPEPGDATMVSTSLPIDTAPTIISFASWDYDRPTYEPLAKKFMAENPSITIKIIPMDDMIAQEQGDGTNAMSQLRQIVSGADTATSTFVTPEALGSDLLLDLKPLMDADANFKRDDFYTGALDRFTVQGGIWQLPRSLQVPLLAYNKDVFKQANLPAPQAGWSWNDLLGAAEQLASKRGSVVDTYGLFDPHGTLALTGALGAQGVDLAITSTEQLQLDQPEVVAAVERIRTLDKAGALLRFGQKSEGENVDPLQLIRDGRVGIWGSEFFGGARLTGDTPFAMGHVPYPGRSATLFGGSGDGYVISAGTAHPTEAWRWIEWLSRQPVGRPNYPPGAIPARQSLAALTGVWNTMDDETRTAYQWTIAHFAPPGSTTLDHSALDTLAQTVHQVADGEQDPAKALVAAERRREDQRVQAQLTPSPTPDTSPVLVATPAPQAALAGANAITFAVLGYNTVDMRRLAREFTDQHPEIVVQLTSPGPFSGPPQLADIARSSDCFTWWGAPQHEADWQALYDLQPLLDADANFPQSDYPTALLAPYRHDGGLWGLPYAATLHTLAYNRTAFDTVGIRPPAAQWKPDDFLAAAQQLTSGEGEKKQYGYASLHPQQDLLFFINQFGGKLTTGEGYDLRPNFLDPQVVAAAQWYNELARVHKVMPPPVFTPGQAAPDNGTNATTLIRSGRVGMWFGQGIGAPDERNGKATFETGLAPLPIGATGLHGGNIDVRGLHISAQTQQAHACWEWLKFLSSDTSGLYDGIPARISVAHSDAFVQEAQPELLQLFKAYGAALNKESGGSDDLGTLDTQLDLYWFFKAVNTAVAGKADLNGELTKAQQTTTNYMECLARPGNNDNKAPTCAKTVDPGYPGQDEAALNP